MNQWSQKALKVTFDGKAYIDLISADDRAFVEEEVVGDWNLEWIFRGPYIFVDLTFNIKITWAQFRIEEIEFEANGFETQFDDFIVIPEKYVRKYEI